MRCAKCGMRRRGANHDAKCPSRAVTERAKRRQQRLDILAAKARAWRRELMARQPHLFEGVGVTP